jgi:hypothetical protein
VIIRIVICIVRTLLTHFLIEIEVRKRRFAGNAA